MRCWRVAGGRVCGLPVAVHNGDMSTRQRKTVSLVMSLVLMIFSICQVQARAAVMPVVAKAVMPAMAMADCHHGERAGDASVVDCHSACKHLQQHKDAAQKLPVPDASPMLLAFLQPFARPAASLALADGYHQPEPLSTDPPASIRFQRFLN